MARIRLSIEESLVVVVDIQPLFMAAIHEADRVRVRSRFLAQCASILGVPVWASEQVPDRMGNTEAPIAPFVERSFAKPEFSIMNNLEMRDALLSQSRRQVILVGIESHICMSQSALGLLEAGFEVVVCPDAMGSRSATRHQVGLDRILASGASGIHTEAVVYEWMVSSTHPKFREVLKVVKGTPV